MIITNPVTTTVAQPYLQLQGCSPERLQSVTFDLSNAVVVLTNQPGVLTGRFLDTNLLSFTTNCFQCFDIPITNALNRITLHATDLAGNVTTTNLNITLDYSLATNPVIRLTWPTNGMQICGSSFTLRGWTEDASAIVTAQIMDTNGGTNVMSGTVERTGVLWVENLPLAEGTNIVTLWVTNSAGLSGKTNICVVKSDMTLTLNSISGSLWLPTVDVNGSISDPTAAVWVNGVQGTNHGDGTWSASGVPVSPGCVASFDMTASPAGGDDPSASANVDKAAEIVMESATWNGNSTYNTDAGVGGGWEVDKVQGNFKAMLGGSQTEHFEEQDSNRVAFVVWDKTDTIGPNKNITLEHDTGYNDWTSVV